MARKSWIWPRRSRACLCLGEACRAARQVRNLASGSSGTARRCRACWLMNGTVPHPRPTCCRTALPRLPDPKDTPASAACLLLTAQITPLADGGASGGGLVGEPVEFAASACSPPVAGGPPDVQRFALHLPPATPWPAVFTLHAEQEVAGHSYRWTSRPFLAAGAVPAPPHPPCGSLPWLLPALLPAPPKTTSLSPTHTPPPCCCVACAQARRCMWTLT